MPRTPLSREQEQRIETTALSNPAVQRAFHQLERADGCTVDAAAQRYSAALDTAIQGAVKGLKANVSAHDQHAIRDSIISMSTEDMHGGGVYETCKVKPAPHAGRGK